MNANERRQSIINYFKEEFEDYEDPDDFIFEVEFKIEQLEDFIDDGKCKSEKHKEDILEQINVLQNECIYNHFLTLKDVKEIVGYYNRKGITCHYIGAYVPLKKQYIEEIRDILIDNWAETPQECDEMEQMKTVKELRAFIKTHMGDDWAIYNGCFINAVTSES